MEKWTGAPCNAWRRHLRRLELAMSRSVQRVVPTQRVVPVQRVGERAMALGGRRPSSPSW